jgi:hypothetical protein
MLKLPFLLRGPLAWHSTEEAVLQHLSIVTVAIAEPHRNPAKGGVLGEVHR